MSEKTPEPPVCPECGADWVESGHRFAIDGKLSDMSVTEANTKYSKNKEKYDATSVTEFECGRVIPSSELPQNN